jgi:hypothetical protein
MLTSRTIKTVFGHVAVCIHMLVLQGTATLLVSGFFNNIGVCASVNITWGFVMDFMTFFHFTAALVSLTVMLHRVLFDMRMNVMLMMTMMFVVHAV